LKEKKEKGKRKSLRRRKKRDGVKREIKKPCRERGQIFLLSSKSFIILFSIYTGFVVFLVAECGGKCEEEDNEGA
jgi:hypothetical protein